MKDTLLRPAAAGDEKLLHELALEGEPGIRANNQMIYYLAANVMNRFTFVAEEDGKAVGYIFAIPSNERQSLWLHQIVVRQKERGKGYGARMLRELKELAASEGFAEVELMVKPENPSRHLYQRESFEEVELNEGLNMFLCRFRVAR